MSALRASGAIAEPAPRWTPLISPAAYDRRGDLSRAEWRALAMIEGRPVGRWSPDLASALSRWQKLPFYAAHNVDEILIVDPTERTVTWLRLDDGDYQPIQRSALIKLGAVELAAQLDWP